MEGAQNRAWRAMGMQTTILSLCLGTLLGQSDWKHIQQHCDRPYGIQAMWPLSSQPHNHW